MSVHICQPRTIILRRVRHCPNCATRRRFVGHVAVWYDTIWTCCHCGDAWSAEGRMPRPFARDWRRQYATKARMDWAMAVPRSEESDALRALLEDEMGAA